MRAWTACSNNYYLSFVEGDSAYASFDLFEKKKAGYAGEKSMTLSAEAEGLTESSEFNCREYVPLLSKIYVDDLDWWEGPEYVAFCYEGYWNFRLYHSKKGRLDATWVFVRNPRL